MPTLASCGTSRLTPMVPTPIPVKIVAEAAGRLTAGMRAMIAGVTTMVSVAAAAPAISRQKP